MMDDLTELCETLAEELKKTNAKLEKAGGEMTSGDLEYIDKLTHALKSVKTTKAMIESEGSYAGETMYNRGSSRVRGSSYARRGGRNTRRDSMGRYSSEPGYSRDEEMISELRELMEDAPDEHTRMEFQKFIQKIEQM
jgi:predicted phage gp36 major capsid-like protein